MPSLPSVIRIRSEGLRGEDVAKLLTRLLPRIVSQLQEGAVVTLNERGARIHRLPIRPLWGSAE